MIAARGELRQLRYRIVYPAHSGSRAATEQALAASLCELGYDVAAVGIPCPGGWWNFPRLDEAMRAREAGLLTAYDQLARELAGADVVISSGGSMLHPDFLRQLSAVTVMICGDDPESSDLLSRPVAPHFDVAFTTNIACVADYRRWGCRNADWLFMPLRRADLVPEHELDELLARDRDLDAVMFCERVYPISDRPRRIERLLAAFPQALVAGNGWPRGFVTDEQMRDGFRRAKIGWNLHHSLGPCNRRLGQLPAWGVLQLCDNRGHLARIFRLGEEVVGFETIDECIELTHHYLAHDDERRRIARNGCLRARSDFTEERWWQRILDRLAPVCSKKLGTAVTAAPVVAAGS